MGSVMVSVMDSVTEKTVFVTDKYSYILCEFRYGIWYPKQIPEKRVAKLWQWAYVYGCVYGACANLS